ncbi:MAG: Replication factor C subunit [candidate division TA06 bacterium 32_111]|uniref:tRNA-splicing ligase RtcB n=2 Tax=Bacteria candidate phyla TaxID=1783234 RepID=A0A348MJM1_UNCW3|nr:MAG: Replication factor C subunit [candidate division TA06 bacterium 32_111]HAF07247.1 RNA-splicing ligase RtcB [candidate division WOR-3 bacterium]
MSYKEFLKRVDENKVVIPKGSFEGMRVDCEIFLNREIEKYLEEDSVKQLVNVSKLPGIVKKSLAMPDIHSGYGFPIGGVAAFDLKNGIISPGGVGYDINCGVRCIVTDLKRNDLKKCIKELLTKIFLEVPSGIGSEGSLRLKKNDLKRIVLKGAFWAVENGFGDDRDLESIESNGCLKGGDFECISEEAIERGISQQGTLGSGNHFLEIDYVSEIFDADIAKKFELFENQIVIMLHTGSRGFGHQICSDYVSLFQKDLRKKGIPLPDKQLVYSYFNSDLGRRYYKAMAGAANYAFCNREIIGYMIKKTILKFFKVSQNDLKIELLYDIAHNIAKIEEYEIDGKKGKLIVHRKGATRSFPKGHPELKGIFKETGQPVLIPGDMLSGGYILVGGERSVEETFSSTCHGAGRTLSRKEAVRFSKRVNVFDKIKESGVFVLSQSNRTIVEEIPQAYKNVDDVVKTVRDAKLSFPVAKLLPIGVIKG